MAEFRCPECHLVHEAPDGVAMVMHRCPKMAGLSTPMVPAGVKAKLVRVDREDYTNGDLVQRDDEGRTVMAIRTVRDDGEDVHVYAPAATARGDAHGLD